jgi:hypothetical protein
MYSVTVKYEVRLARPERTKIRNDLQSWQSQTIALLSQIPGPVKYPIRWTSAKQRRAFFATDGFGRGIPTRRTGAVAKWEIDVDYEEVSRIERYKQELIVFFANLNPLQQNRPPAALTTGVIISIGNNVPYQQYVTGINQQGFHADTGWINAPVIVDTQKQKAEGIIQGL